MLFVFILYENIWSRQENVMNMKVSLNFYTTDSFTDFLEYTWIHFNSWLPLTEVNTDSGRDKLIAIVTAHMFLLSFTIRLIIWSFLTRLLEYLSDFLMVVLVCDYVFIVGFQFTNLMTMLLSLSVSGFKCSLKIKPQLFLPTNSEKQFSSLSSTTSIVESFTPSKEIAVSKRYTVILHLLSLYVSISYKDGLGQIYRLFFWMENYVGSNRHCVAILCPEDIVVWIKTIWCLSICRLYAIVETLGIAVGIRSYNTNLHLQIIRVGK